MEQKAEFVEIDEGNDCWGTRSIYASNMLDIAGSIVRHDSKKAGIIDTGNNITEQRATITLGLHFN